MYGARDSFKIKIVNGRYFQPPSRVASFDIRMSAVPATRPWLS
jgi:hypothetical protein